MRLIPARRLVPQPAKIKGTVSQIKRVETPIKGLSLLGKASEGDPQTATILTNWIVKEDRVCVRPGSKLFTDLYPSPAARHPVVALMPFLAAPMHMLAASAGNILRLSTGSFTLVRGGFTSDDWHWSMFADLGQQKWLIMVNGADGVWSYDGGTTPDPVAVAVTAITAANPTVLTVAAGDIAKFHDGQTVVVAGAGRLVVSGQRPARHRPRRFRRQQFRACRRQPERSERGRQHRHHGGSAGLAVEAGDRARREHGLLQPRPVLDGAGAPQPALLRRQRQPLPLLPAAAAEDRHAGAAADERGLQARRHHPRHRHRGRSTAAQGMDDKLVVFSSNGEAAIYTGIDPDGRRLRPARRLPVRRRPCRSTASPITAAICGC